MENKNKINKVNKEILKDFNETEIISTTYEGGVYIKDDKVLKDGIVIDVLNTNAKIKKLWKEHLYNEYGTTDINAILKMEGF